MAALAGVPASAWPALQPPAPTRRGPFWLRGLARLSPGSRRTRRRRDLRRISADCSRCTRTGTTARARLTPIPLREAIVGKADRPVTLFAVAVILVLLVAVANVGHAAAGAGDRAPARVVGARRARRLARAASPG